MADFGNQMEGATEGLDRFLDALDNAAVKLGSNAALESRIAREEFKRINQENRFKKTLNKMETDHAKQVKTMQPVYKKLWTGIKAEVAQRSLLTKGMKEMSKSMTEFAKKALGGIGKGITTIGKAGALGAMVASVKLITDGLLASDAAMAKLSGRVSMTRKELVGVGTAAKGAQANMADMGVSLAETTATAGNLVEAFGQTKYVTDQTIESALRLEKAYGLSSESAANLTEHLVRSNSSMREFTDMVVGKANTAMVSAGLVMRDLASRTQQMSMHGERGVEAMTQLAVRAAKAGTSMKGFDGMSAAFSDIDTTIKNLGEVGAAFPDLVAKMGNPEEIYWAMFEGGAAAEKKQQEITDALAEQFNWDKKRGLLDKNGRKVAEGRIKQLAQSIGMETEFMIRQIRSTDDLNNMNATDRAAELARLKDKEDALDRENAVIKNSQTMLQKISSIWKGLYTTLVGQLDEIFWTGETGAAEFGSSIDLIGVKLKEALSLDTFAKDVKEGGWAEAIGDRLKPIMKSVAIALQDKLKEVFPNFAKEIEAGGGGVGGFVTAFKGRIIEGLRAGLAEALGKSPEEINELAKTATTTLGVMGAVGGVVKVMSALKGTFLNPMWVQMKGMGGFGGKAGPAAAKVAGPRGAAGIAYDRARDRGAGRLGAAQSAMQQAGQGNMVKGASKLAAQQAVTSSKNAAKLAGAAAKGVGKGLLKKIPLLGAAAGIYFAYDRIANGGDWLGGMLELGSGIASIIPGAGTAVSVGIDAALMARDVKRAGDATAEPDRIHEAVQASALGRIGGGLSLVGEGGAGEVVISRSALRNGIGVGGRAASALAGIGVPGYRTGYVTADTSSITGREGLMGAQGSQSFRAARASAFEQEQLRQQAAMLNYWRNVYDQKMDALVEGAKQEKEKGPPWLAKMFLRYNKEIGQQLKKTGPTMSAAIMAGMTKWSTDQDIAGAVGVAVKAGITAGINDPGSKLNELLKKTGEWQGTLTTGLAAIAQGKSLKGAAKSMLPMGANVLANRLFGQGAGGQAAKYLGMSTAATGKYVNSPTLMMVGEGGAGEVVIPTERIRKGLPINAGVARELGSIGVPGFQDGGFLSDIGSAFSMGQRHQTMSTGGMYGTALGGGKLGGYAMGSGQRFGEMGGFGGMAKAGGAGALMTFGNVFAQTGDWKRAGTAGVGAGLGVGMGMGLTALGVPPPLSGMIGNALGGLATKGLNSVFNLTGGYGKGRRRSLKLIEQHIKSGGKFDHGAPGNLKRAMDQAIGGYEKTPTEANFQKLTESLGTSKYVSSMGIPAPALIALGTGQVSGGAATKMFSSINTSLYGSEGGKYRKALGIPMAAGGIVNRPTTALIGERGPEAVVPLGDSEMMQELKKQNKLMVEMIKTQKETAKTEIRMDGRLVSEVVGENFYDVGNGL